MNTKPSIINSLLSALSEIALFALVVVVLVLVVLVVAPIVYFFAILLCSLAIYAPRYFFFYPCLLVDTAALVYAYRKKEEPLHCVKASLVAFVLYAVFSIFFCAFCPELTNFRLSVFIVQFIVNIINSIFFVLWCSSAFYFLKRVAPENPKQEPEES